MMIWDSTLSIMEDFNVNEWEWAMGFHTNTITMFNIPVDFGTSYQP
jgi:hypothetical protein